MAGQLAGERKGGGSYNEQEKVGGRGRAWREVLANCSFQRLRVF